MALPDKNISANVVWYYAICGESAEQIAYRLQLNTVDVVDALKTFKLYNTGMQSNPSIACGAYKRLGLKNGTIHDVVWDDVADYIEANYSAPIKENLETYLNRVYCHKLSVPRLIIPAGAVGIALILVLSIAGLVAGSKKPSKPAPPPVTTITDPVDNEPSLPVDTEPQYETIIKPSIEMEVDTIKNENDTETSESSSEERVSVRLLDDYTYIGCNIDGEPSGYNILLDQDDPQKYIIQNNVAGKISGLSVEHYYQAPYTVTVIGRIDENRGDVQGIGIYKLNNKTVVGEFRDGSFISGSKVYLYSQDEVSGEVTDSIVELTSTFYPSGRDFKSYVKAANRVADGWINEHTSADVTKIGKFELSEDQIIFNGAKVYVSNSRVEVEGEDFKYVYSDDECIISDIDTNGESVTVKYTPTLVSITTVTISDEGYIQQEYTADITNLEAPTITEEVENTEDEGTEGIEGTEITEGEQPENIEVTQSEEIEGTTTSGDDTPPEQPSGENIKDANNNESTDEDIDGTEIIVIE